MTPEDLYDFHFLADAQISPDGSRVAYVVRTIDRDSNAYQSAIWLVPADGSGEGTRFTSGPGQDALPRWSPDGKTLAFVSDRDAPSGDGKKRKPKNVFVLSLAGGEARQLTSFDDDGGDLTWSPRWAPDRVHSEGSARQRMPTKTASASTTACATRPTRVSCSMDVAGTCGSSTSRAASRGD